MLQSQVVELGRQATNNDSGLPHGTTPSFPQAFGGNPAQRSFLDSRQKPAGMTIEQSERICISCLTA
jgi:hypothetical protein